METCVDFCGLDDGGLWDAHVRDLTMSPRQMCCFAHSTNAFSKGLLILGGRNEQIKKHVIGKETDTEKFSDLFWILYTCDSVW